MLELREQCYPPHAGQKGGDGCKDCKVAAVLNGGSGQAEADVLSAGKGLANRVKRQTEKQAAG